MLLNLSDVLSEQHKPIDTTVDLSMDAYQEGSASYPFVHKNPVHIIIEHVKGRELLIKADTSLQVLIPCDRCLQPVEIVLDLQVERHVNLLPDAVLSDELDESNFIDGYNLDVDQLLHSEMLTVWPAKVLCDIECQGICSVCGQNLNEGNCNCEDTGLDPRMSAIRDMFSTFTIDE